MAFCRLVFPILVLSAVSSFADIQVPVFLWGDLKTSIKSNPLSNVGQEEFKAILNKELAADPFTVIFIDETLSVEDFSHKNAEGETSFPYLHANIGKAVYLPSVDEALGVLDNLADPEKVDHVKLTENGLSAEFESESVKILFITLKDAREGESRAELLRRHNDFMEEMYTKLENKYDNVVAIYTAEFPSWTIPESHSRVRRQAVEESNEHILNGLKLYVKQLTLTVGSERTNFTSIETYSTDFHNGTETMSTTIKANNNSITLNFDQKAGYWYFSSVTVDEVEPRTLSPDSEVYAPMGFSYRCAQSISFSVVNQTNYNVMFQDLQVQPFFRETSSNETVFGDSINCVGFFSVPIWSGLFVVFILLAITFYGIMMMMDIRTMDRFDDPKGKTITINTAE